MKERTARVLRWSATALGLSVGLYLLTQGDVPGFALNLMVVAAAQQIRGGAL